MRTTVIPAQITTVEDKIAGNLNFTQILLFMTPILFSTLIYALMPVRMHLTLYKLPLILIISISCFILAIRIKGKIILQWLSILLRFNLRPKYYTFDKNDSTFRVMYVPLFEKKQFRLRKKVATQSKTNVIPAKFDIKELVQIEKLIQDPRISLSFKTNGIGGGKLNVAFKQI
jgi:hypothetical protein